MNIIDKLKFNMSYPELKDLNIDDEMICRILASKNFKNNIKQV